MDTNYLACLAFSIAIEVPVVIAIVRYRQRQDPPPWPRIAWTGILATATTLPYLWFLVPGFVPAYLYWWVGEAMVIVIEAAIIAFVLQVSAKDSLLASTLCNLASLGLGWAVISFLGD